MTATPDGTRLLTADEGEIPDDCSGDPAEIPEGSVSVIDLPVDPADLDQDDVTMIGFDGPNAIAAADPDIRRAPEDEIATYQQDFEPEYVVGHRHVHRAARRLRPGTAPDSSAPPC